MTDDHENLRSSLDRLNEISFSEAQRYLDVDYSATTGAEPGPLKVYISQLPRFLSVLPGFSTFGHLLIHVLNVHIGFPQALSPQYLQLLGKLLSDAPQGKLVNAMNEVAGRLANTNEHELDPYRAHFFLLVFQELRTFLAGLAPEEDDSQYGELDELLVASRANVLQAEAVEDPPHDEPISEAAPELTHESTSNLAIFHDANPAELQEYLAARADPESFQETVPLRRIIETVAERLRDKIQASPEELQQLRTDPKRIGWLSPLNLDTGEIESPRLLVQMVLNVLTGISPINTFLNSEELAALLAHEMFDDYREYDWFRSDQNEKYANCVENLRQISEFSFHKKDFDALRINTIINEKLCPEALEARLAQTDDPQEQLSLRVTLSIIQELIAVIEEEIERLEASDEGRMASMKEKWGKLYFFSSSPGFKAVPPRLTQNDVTPTFAGIQPGRPFDVDCVLSGEKKTFTSLGEATIGPAALINFHLGQDPDGNHVAIRASGLNRIQGNIPLEYRDDPRKFLGLIYSTCQRMFPDQGEIPLEWTEELQAELAAIVRELDPHFYSSPQDLLFIEGMMKMFILEPHVKEKMRVELERIGGEPNIMPQTFAADPRVFLLVEEFCDGEPLGHYEAACHPDLYSDFSGEDTQRILFQVSKLYEAALNLGWTLADHQPVDFLIHPLTKTLKVIDWNLVKPKDREDKVKQRRSETTQMYYACVFASNFMLRIAYATPDEALRCKLFKRVLELDELVLFPRTDPLQETTLSEKPDELNEGQRLPHISEMIQLLRRPL